MCVGPAPLQASAVCTTRTPQATACAHTHTHTPGAPPPVLHVTQQHQQGSMNMSYDSSNLTTPGARCMLVCLSVCLSVCLPVCLSVCQSGECKIKRVHVSVVFEGQCAAVRLTPHPPTQNTPRSPPHAHPQTSSGWVCARVTSTASTSPSSAGCP
jgi:hypothetical protein